MQLYHGAVDLPSPQEIARALPGGRIRPGNRIAFQDPFDPKRGKRPCTVWLRANLPDGFTVADARGKIDGIVLKDHVRQLVPRLGAFVPRRTNGPNGKAHSPAGGPVVRDLSRKGSRNGEGGAHKARPLQPPLVTHDAFTLLSSPAPHRRWHVENGWMPADDVTLLGADGGEGKTTLGLQLAYCTAWGFEWLRNRVRAGAAVYYTAEEPIGELHYRLEKIREAIVLPGEPPNPLRLISRADRDAMLAYPDLSTGTMLKTPLFDELEALIRDLEAKLLVLDAAADVFGGNEIDRAQVRSFIRLLRGVAINNDCAVLLLSHPSVDGMRTGRGYSGSTHWSNAVRSRYYFTTPKKDDREPDQDLRQLDLAKSNRSRRGAKIMMRWRNGVFFVEDSDKACDALTLGKAKQVFLEVLRSCTDQGWNLSHQPGPSYAPKLIAAEARAEGLGKELLAKAMSALFAEKRLKVEPYGRPSRPSSRLVEVVESEPE